MTDAYTEHKPKDCPPRLNKRRMTNRPLSIHAKWFKCADCGTKVIVGDYYYYEAMRLRYQHKCQGCAEGEIRNRWEA